MTPIWRTVLASYMYLYQYIQQELLLTPLVIAVQYGHIQLVNCLLQKGANPNAPAEVLCYNTS